MTRSIPSGRAMFDKETVHVHDILSPDSLAEFPEAVRSGGVRELFWSHHCFAKGLRLERFTFDARRFVLSPTSKSPFSKPSPIKP